MTILLPAGDKIMPTRRALLAALIALGASPAARAQFDSASGMRDLLITAARAATTRLGRTNGFFGDPVVRIPLPGVLGAAQRRLQPAGLSAPLDDVELRMNRAAESVMPVARDLVTDAIRRLSFSDVLGIVRGGDTAATAYLRGETEPALTRHLRPPMEDTLSQSGAYAALDRAGSLVDGQSARGIGQLLGRGRGGSIAGDLRGTVTDFAVEKALDGVFHYVGEEERTLRRDPLRRSEDVLRGLFGR